MPILGLGVFQSPPEETVTAVEAAIDDGYRLIDTAAAYGNEREVGDGLRSSGIDRVQMFVTTKLWISDYGYDQALVGFDGCLRRLGLDYVDLFLLHHPVPSDFASTVGAYKAAPSSKGQWSPADWRGSVSNSRVSRAIVAAVLLVAEAASRPVFRPAFNPA
jgi:diketogulonate reductase-like aldo/keto reductase